MSAPERRRPRPSTATSVILFAMLIAASLPLLRVVQYGAWHPQALASVAIVLFVALAVRFLRWPNIAATLAGSLLGGAYVIASHAGQDAVLGVIPTAKTFGDLRASAEAAIAQVIIGEAPIAATVELSVMLVVLFATLATITDLIVNTLRLPLVGSVLLIAASLVPTLIVPAATDLATFVVLTALTFMLLRSSTRRTEREREPGSASGTSVVAVSVVVVSLLLTTVITPFLPTAAPGAAGIVQSNAISPTLNLGSDLRQPRDSVALEVRTDDLTAPYLRVASLSRFDGAAWHQTVGDVVELEALHRDAPLGTDADIRVTEYTTQVSVVDLNSVWLPVPYSATGIEGLNGGWQAMPEDGSILATAANASGQQYTVTSRKARPSLEQIRAATTVGEGLAPDYIAMPDGVPSIIVDNVIGVTADAQTQYDKLEALQRWFRGEFTYSLEAPVADGFDGSDLEAMEGFLRERSGYCVHFASAFALMGRAIDIPTRVVVGFLPGTAARRAEGQTVYEVSSANLHAWPEAWFDGIGWIPFEPTTSLGTPTTFSLAANPPPAGGTDIPPVAEPSAAPSASAAPSPTPTPTRTSAATPSAPVSFDPAVILMVLGIVLAAGALLLIPRGLRAMRTADRRTKARSGDATAAWREAQDTAVDLGIAVPGAESPRAFGDRLVHAHGADPSAVETLVEEIELRSYAAGTNRFANGEAVAAALAETQRSLLAGAGRRRTLVAQYLPRSLVLSPGSALAARFTTDSAPPEAPTQAPTRSR